MAAEDKGLVKRGLVLLAVLTVLAVGVGYMLFRRSPAPESKEQPRAEPFVTMVPVPSASFPASINWAALVQLDESLPSNPGWQIRYAATQVLCHKGSTQLPLHILREMLDEERQRRNHRVLLKDGKVVSNEADVQRVLLLGLRSLHAWYQHKAAVAALRDHPEMAKIVKAVDTLAAHRNAVIRTEAAKVRLTLQTK